MHNGAKLLGFSAMLVLSACDGEKGKLTIRSTGTPLSPEVKQLPSRVAEGRSQFALGNVALALQSFRKAVRDEPGNIDAIIGVASCYDRMGRYDLSRRHYEAALAIEPANQRALAALAASLDFQGKAKESAAVRDELRQRLAGPRGTLSPAPSEQIAVRKLATIDLESVVKSMLLADEGQLVRKPVVAVAMPESLASTAAQQGGASDVRVKSALNSVTKELSPALAQSVTTEPSVLASPLARAIEFEPGPRLERTSAAEVKLVTRNAEPMRELQVVQRTAETSRIRFVPLRQAQARVPIRVLNAARVDRLAANTRSLMSRQGWKNVAIGNASTVHKRSVVYYPASARPVAQRLAAQLGFASALRAGSGDVTVLLGRDAAALVRKRATTS